MTVVRRSSAPWLALGQHNITPILLQQPKLHYDWARIVEHGSKRCSVQPSNGRAGEKKIPWSAGLLFQWHWRLPLNQRGRLQPPALPNLILQVTSVFLYILYHPQDSQCRMNLGSMQHWIGNCTNHRKMRI